jgi:hypothetical protein
MSCVFPSCGLAIFLPLRSAGFVIDGLVTRNAPPDAAPDTILMACLLDFWYALIDGPGPMNEASSAPEKIAVVTSGPALNDCGFSVTFLPRYFSKTLPWMPMSAGAWVTFGK